MLTWKNIADKISTMSEEDKNKPAQIFEAEALLDTVQPLKPIVTLDTVGNLEIMACRNIIDNTHNGADFVLLVDMNPYAEDGAICYELSEDGETPIYGIAGKTPENKQVSYDPPSEGKTREYILQIVQNRADTLEMIG